MCMHVGMMMMGHALYMCIKGEKKVYRRTRGDLDVCIKKKHKFDRKRKKNDMLNDGMVMYVNERSPFFFFSTLSFSNRCSFSLCVLASTIHQCI